MTAAQSLARFSVVNPGISESVFRFGKNDGLVGVLTQPQPGSVPLPTIVLLNAGVLHRVGPYRSSVTLARLLAENGFPTFRFDLSGLGDSEPRHEIASDRERAVQDIKEALDTLEATRGSKSFVLVGLCSGADNGHFYATQDSRVVGCIFLDAFFYKTLGYYWHYYRSKLVRAKLLRNIFFNPLQFFSKVFRFVRSEVVPSDQRTYIREFPPRNQVEKEIASLLDRGVRLLYVYTAGSTNHINHKGQFRAMFPHLGRRQNLEMEYAAHADHTYTTLESRKWLHNRIVEYVNRFKV